MIGFKRIFHVLARKRPLLASEEDGPRLSKVLTAFDLTALGIGSTLGVGVYVLAGEVSKLYAGPGLVLSFVIAAIASVFAGLCYAEFGARVPKAGSAYVYSYVTIGEFIAFIIGWNLILEYAIGAASVAKALSTYLDTLIGYKMSEFLKTYMPINADGLEDYPDLFAFGVVMLFAAAIAIGAKESVIVNNVFTFLNLGVVLFVIISGLFKVDPSNWSIPAEDVPNPEENGTGGFLPFGFQGVIKGAAVCFYGFIGFDCIATAGEEAKNPQKSIPISVIVSLFIIFLAYFGISTVLTMMLPYYEQDPQAPLPHVFDIYGMTVTKYIVSIGALFGLCASLMGAMFPLPRIVFAMAEDGLLFEFMGSIHKRFHTPLIGTLITGFLTALLSGFFKLGQLIRMMSIGTLLAYSMVAACVMILRYRYCEELGSNDKEKEATPFRQLFNLNKLESPSKLSTKISLICIICFVIFCFPFAISLNNLMVKQGAYVTGDYLFVSLSVIPPALFLILLALQPQSKNLTSFKVPLVPVLPALSILINIYLILELDIWTWVRFVIWIAIGLVIYLTYGARHSKLRKITE